MNAKEKVITVKVDEKMLKELDAFSKKMKLNRSQFVRNLIDTGLDDYRIMSSTGLLAVAVKGYDLIGAVKKAIEKKQFKIEDEKRLIIDL